MNDLTFSTREFITILGIVISWVIAFYTVKFKTASNEEAVKKIATRLDLKDKRIRNLEDEKIRLESTYLTSSQAYKKFVSKEELKMLEEKIDMKITNIDNNTRQTLDLIRSFMLNTKG
ncbi:MAG: hypothetical protein U9P72_00765 [Campylobacterota bacterium]|nr:hypothetical protein [Campylobacterota bacterium]